VTIHSGSRSSGAQASSGSTVRPSSAPVRSSGVDCEGLFNTPIRTAANRTERLVDMTRKGSEFRVLYGPLRRCRSGRCHSVPPDLGPPACQPVVNGGSSPHSVRQRRESWTVHMSSAWRAPSARSCERRRTRRLQSTGSMSRSCVGRRAWRGERLGLRVRTEVRYGYVHTRAIDVPAARVGAGASKANLGGPLGACSWRPGTETARHSSDPSFRLPQSDISLMGQPGSTVSDWS
jgi:hypothetical protein